jgi:predicted TIM-barrel fold metal-dependent hydrolase
MVIDCHAHYPASDGRFPERLVERLPEAGIDKICLFSAGEVFGHASNATILGASRQHPEQIIAFALVELGKDTPEQVDEYAQQGFRGFKITNPRSAYDDEAYFPLYERMENAGLPLLAHTGILMRTPPRKGVRVNSNWMRPICLDPVLRSFPRLNIIGAHLGVPWHEEASTMARLHPNYYVDLTGACLGGWRLNKTAEFFRYHFFWENAWDKVLFGTDILSLDELIPSKRFHDRMIDQIGLPAEIRRKIYGDTAARLLGLQSAVAQSR